MLPLNSPRWANLKVCIGYAQHIAEELQAVYDAIEADPPNHEQLQSVVKQMFYQMEDLDHQNTTYTAAGAAVPHYVNLLPSLEVQWQIDLLWCIAMLHYDAAGARLKRAETRTPIEKETQFEDLSEWYEQAIVDAMQFAQGLAKSDTTISASLQFKLFEAIANLNGDNSTYYMFRDMDQYEFKCPTCDAELLAELIDDKASDYSESANYRYQVRQESEEKAKHWVIATPADSSTPVAEYFTPVEAYRDLMLAGNQTAVLNWLNHLMGNYPCPACQQNSFIAYDDYFRR